MSKFNVGDRVCFYDAAGWGVPAVRSVGTIVNIYKEYGTASVKLDKSNELYFGAHKEVNVVIRNLHRIKKPKSIVWESENIIGCCEQIKTDGTFDIVDSFRFSRDILSQFLGSRVRIVITEAKPQDKRER